MSLIYFLLTVSFSPTSLNTLIVIGFLLSFLKELTFLLWLNDAVKLLWHDSQVKHSKFYIQDFDSCEVKPTSSHSFNPWKSFGRLQRVITKISVSTVLITSLFGVFMNLARYNIRESISSWWTFRRSFFYFSHFFTFSFKRKTLIPFAA